MATERQGSCTPNCGACCKFLILAVSGSYMEPDKRNWLELHGIKLWQQGDYTWARIEARCRHLTDDNRCGIYGRPERPQVCAEFPFAQGDIDIVDEWAGEKVCSYSFSSSREEELIHA